ncbi:metal-dependent transcriptional regulator [Rhodococcus sp. 24CO]|uniref:metal-dependent transcriptional regulator n=1 Tax=Rhodococcus sp. 24CO TaxID=3117460 RepID=UPI003D33AAF2
MKEIVNTTEMYLRTIYDLNEDCVPVRQSRLIERMHQAAATVFHTVARMKRAGLVSIADDNLIELTDPGSIRAIEVTRKHRLAERLLTDVINMPTTLVHGEACRLQHVMSEEAERRIVDLLGGPTTSPWGNPIPGLEHFGITVESMGAATKLADIPESTLPVTGVVRCISEHAQSDPELITFLVNAGVIPGARVTIRPSGKSYAIRGLDEIELPKKLAHIIDVDCTSTSSRHLRSTDGSKLLRYLTIH